MVSGKDSDFVFEQRTVFGCSKWDENAPEWAANHLRKPGPCSPLASRRSSPIQRSDVYLPIGRRHDRIEASHRNGTRGLQQVDDASSNAAVVCIRLRQLLP